MAAFFCFLTLITNITGGLQKSENCIEIEKDFTV